MRPLLILALCGTVFGQASTTLSGGARLGSGARLMTNGSGGNTGGPLTYTARTGNCVHGYSTNAITVSPFYNPATETCINGATTGQEGSALVFQAGASDPLPFLRLDNPTAPALVNTSFTSPDFGSYSVFATDRNSFSGGPWGVGTTTGWSLANEAWGLGTANDMLLTPNGQTVQWFLHVIESRVLAHTCSTGNPCVVQSNVVANSCTPSATTYTSPYCTHTQISSKASIVPGRVVGDAPNTIYEFVLPQVYKLAFTSSLTGGFPDGVSDSVTRTLYVDFSSDSGGSIPASVVPAGYNSTWNGLPEISDDGSFTIASGGGSPYASVGSSVTTDTFIMPVNNVTGISGHMFQATTPGTKGSSEPNWAGNCPAQGNTCSEAPTGGTAVWTDIGAVTSQGPGFDLFYFSPTRGARYINTRTGKVFNGTNEGPNWPSTGTADTAGHLITDDAITCYKQNGSNCGTGGTVNLPDIGTLHGAGVYNQGRYGHFTPTGGGSKNNNYVGGSGDPTQSAIGNGSCAAGTPSWTNFQTYPNMTFVSGNSYTNGKWVSSPVDHNYYKLTGTTGTYMTDPSADSANWQYNSGYCYNYIPDWYSNIVEPEQEIGPIFGADSHGATGYALDFRGGKYISHYLTHPQCQTLTGTCAGQYIGAPQNPGVFALSLSLPADGHPTWANEGLNNGQHDLQPIFDPTSQVFGSAGVGRMPAYSGTPGNSGYTSAGYDEIIAFSTDGLQTLYRFGSTYDSGSNVAFAVQNASGKISQDGKLFAWCGDFMNTRGDVNTGSATCVNPVVAMYAPATGGCVALNDYVKPTTGNAGAYIYKITSLGSAVQGSCVPLYTEGTVPTWNQTVSGTATDSVGIVFTNDGVNSCRPDIAVMDVTSAKPATGHTINAASCSSANVLTAIASASNGDTVAVPAGTCTWTTPSSNTPTIALSKSITLQGTTVCSGSPVTCVDGTIINDGTGSGYDENLIDNNANNSRITGFSFKDPRNLSDAKYPVQLACNSCRFDHNSVTQANTAGATHGLYVFSSVSGGQLIDHNYFANLNGGADVDGSGSDGTFPGDQSWSSTLTPGSGNAAYIESNNFTCDYAAVACPLDGAYDAYAGARVVFRFNTLTNYNLGGHGLDSGGLRSTLLQEVYDNTFTTPGSHIYTAMGTRGGTHMIFSNTVNASGGSYDSFLWLQEYRSSNGYSWGSPSGALCGGSPTNNIDSNSSHGWICRDQVGRGPETASSGDWPINTSSPSFSEASFPGYEWGNLFKGSAPTTSNIEVCDAVPNCSSSNATLYQVLNNRDFYIEAAGTCTAGGSCTAGVGSGTTLPTTCTTGVGFWKTNEGSWKTTLAPNTSGLLYQCSSTNTWKLYYTPYTYPHP